MISDYGILGVREGAEIAEIKRGFRRKVKELHPDLSGDRDPLGRHALFVEACEAYKRLLGGGGDGHGARPTAKPASRPAGRSASGGRGVVAHSDPAYAFYRTGMRYFMMIHPSQWNLDTGRMLNTRIAGNEEDQEVIKAKVADLVKLFPRAYYYFGVVAHEYPESDWACDAREKMAKIEERIGMYKRIIESFSSWNLDRKDAIRQYRERYAKDAETRKAVRRDEPEGWAN